jgi:hypothetical protein
MFINDFNKCRLYTALQIDFYRSDGSAVVLNCLTWGRTLIPKFDTKNRIYDIQIAVFNDPFVISKGFAWSFQPKLCMYSRCYALMRLLPQNWGRYDTSHSFGEGDSISRKQFGSNTAFEVGRHCTMNLLSKHVGVVFL